MPTGRAPSGCGSSRRDGRCCGTPGRAQAIESRTNATPAVLDYMDSFIGMFRAGGFSVDLTHHVMHALGSRMWGFTQELFDDRQARRRSPAGRAPEAQAAMFQQMAARYPNIVEIATAARHDEGSVVGHGCDDQFEFEFALDLLLDGFERLHEQGWSSRRAKPGRTLGGRAWHGDRPCRTSDFGGGYAHTPGGLP